MSNHLTSDQRAMMVAGWAIAGLLAIVVWFLMRPPAVPPKVPEKQAQEIDAANLAHAVQVWQKTVDVQQHFNQIEMDIRKSALTVILAVIGAAGYVAEKNMTVRLGAIDIPVAFILLVAAAVAWLQFYLMDAGWYHRLLRGSVDQGMALERDLSASGIPIDLTNCIGRRSPLMIGRRKLHSDDKIKLFYRPVLALIIALAVGSWFIKPTDEAAEKQTAPSIHRTP